MLARLREALRLLSVGIVAGIPVGILVVGLGGRLAMRVSGFLSAPELQGTRTEFGAAVGTITFGGTLFLVVFFGVSAGIGGGALYAVMRPWLTRAGRWRGLAFGAVLLALIGSQIIDPGNFDFRRFGPAAVNVAMFSALFLLFGTLIEPLYARIEAASSSKRPSTAERIVGILVWLAAAGTLLFLTFVVVANAIQITLGRHSAEMVLAAVAGALLMALIVVVVATGRRLPRVAVYGVFGVAVLVGTVRTLAGIAQILAG